PPRIFLDDVGHFIICESRETGRRLRIPGEKHSNDVQLLVEARHFIHLAQRHFASEESFGRFPERLHRTVEETRGRQMDVHIYGFGHWVTSVACSTFSSIVSHRLWTLFTTGPSRLKVTVGDSSKREYDDRNQGDAYENPSRVCRVITVVIDSACAVQCAK